MVKGRAKRVFVGALFPGVMLILFVLAYSIVSGNFSRVYILILIIIFSYAFLGIPVLMSVLLMEYVIFRRTTKYIYVMPIGALMGLLGSFSFLKFDVGLHVTCMVAGLLTSWLILYLYIKENSHV